MADEAYIKLDREEAQALLAEINPAPGQGAPDPAQATILARDLPFYPGYRFLDIADYGRLPPLHRYVIHKAGKTTILDWSNGPIYALNKEAPLTLDENNVLEYVRFFFSHVRGRHGRFVIAESVDDISWRDDPPPAARKAMGKLLESLTIIEKNRKTGYIVEARLMFRDSLFRARISISLPDGHVSVSDEELLVEEMPVLDDVFNQ